MVLNVPMEVIMGRIWTDEDVKLLNSIYKEKNDDELSIIFRRPKNTIIRKLRRLRLCRNEDYNRLWNESDEQFLRDNYFNGDLIKIAKALNRTEKAIRERAKVLQIKRNPELVRLNGHTYTINENFFKTWSDDMAYILGFIWTDGNMGRHDYSISITQHKDDKYILENIYKIIGSNQKPHENESTFNIGVYNKIIYEDLQKLGLVPAKSKIIDVPIGLPKEYFASFIRGALDGDGSVSSKNKRLKISTASRKFAYGLSEFLNALGIEHQVVYSPYVLRESGRLARKNEIKPDDVYTDFFNVCVRKKKDLLKLYRLMYNNPALYLKRKKQSFVDMGIEEPDFLIKNKHVMRKIEGTNAVGEKIEFEQVKIAKQNGYPTIDHALSSGKEYKGYTWRYLS